MTDAIARGLVEVVLRRIREGALDVHEPDGTHRRYGVGESTACARVHSSLAWRRLLRGSLGMADAYAEGLWDSPDLVALIRLAARNAPALDRARLALRPLVGPVQLGRELVRAGGRRQRRRDVAAHYDLGNTLFARMLDPTMTYSCALFDTPDASLQEAQVAKLELVCRTLELGPGDRVLEIGTGWGSFALHAAATRGCHVTTTTISAEQHEYASRLVREAGLEDRVTVLASDYRDLRGRYDKLVSLEMIEAVGWRRTGAFLRACCRLLTPEGAMLLQAITIDDRAYDVEKSSRSFIKQRIFPGGSLPSLASLRRDLARATDFRLAGLLDLTPHYATTLRHWRERFAAHAPELAALGYDEHFQRLWTFYLAYCEAGFAERRIEDVQLLLARPGWGAGARDGRALASGPAGLRAVGA